MKLLLIHPYNEQFPKIQESFPIGIGYLLSKINRSIYDLTFLDCALEKIEPTSDKFGELIISLNPDVVGISWWSQNSDIVEKMLHVVKSLVPKATTIVGGPHPTVRTKDAINHPNCDFIFKGEAEIGFPMLLDCIRKKDFDDLTEIPGLVFKNNNGKIIVNKQQFINDLDVLGRIDYDMVNLKKYHQAGYTYGGKAVPSGDKIVAPIVATRGCPYLCQFCSARVMNGRKVRTHSPTYIVDTIKQLYNDHNVRLVSLVDDNFTFNVDFAAKVCDKIISLNYGDLRMATPNGIRFERMTRDVARKMYAAGWRDVPIAPESGSHRTLERMGKTVDLEKIPPAVEMFHRAGLKVHAFFMIGYANETIEDLLATESFIYKNNFDNIALHTFQPLPGTPIFDELIKRGEIKPSFVPGAFNQITYSPKNLSKEEIRDATNRIWNNFRDQKGWKYENAKVYSIRE
jgi:radical SAM superfamily enzyme YgiQ (UPF0313 family)